MYKRSLRPLEPSIQDDRGRLVRSIGKAQTFLTEAQIDQIVELYTGGLTLLDVGCRFGISQHAARTAIAKAGVTIRPKGRLSVTPISLDE